MNFALFETKIGVCGIAWRAAAVAGMQLPQANERATRARMLRRFNGAAEAAPPVEIERAIECVKALLHGEKRDLSTIELDMEGVPAFHRRVYEVARAIPCGSTMTYGEIATRLGDPSSARAVGQALGRNPFAIIVPCHRVLAAHGRMGGFSASGGVITKQRLLFIEGAQQQDVLPFGT